MLLDYITGKLLQRLGFGAKAGETSTIELIDDWYKPEAHVDPPEWPNSPEDIPNLVDDAELDIDFSDILGDIESAGNVGKIITEVNYTPSSGANLKANPNKTTTILGSYEKDMKNIIDEMGNVKSTYFGAQKGGFNVLNVPDDMYKNADQFWDEVNVKWLDEAIARGDVIILATKPTSDVLWKIDPVSRTRTLTGFGREYKHMLDNEYVYIPLSNMMVKK